MNIGINGMGRIGRSFFRVLHQQKQLHMLRAINDVMPKAHLAYLINYDTVRGTLPSKVHLTDKGIEVDGHEIMVHQCSQPQDIPWHASEVHVVVEATGVFTKRSDLNKHIEVGATYCLLTTSGEADLPLFISGVNDQVYAGQKVFSIGSCTVNGTAPLLNSLQQYDPKSVMINVIHAYSSRQNILDSYHGELRRSRAAADNIIPLNINLNVSLERLFPRLQHKIDSMTSRVPIPCGVLTDLTMLLASPPKDKIQLLDSLRNAGRKEVMEVTEEPLVSSDVINNTHSLVVDAEFVQVIDNHIKIMVWFDNEWGFSNRLYDWVCVKLPASN